MRVVAVPKPQKVIRAAPAPARVALAPQATRKQAAPAAQRTAARRPATEREGLSRGSVSLIGVFGGEGGRHASGRPRDAQRAGGGDRRRVGAAQRLRPRHAAAPAGLSRTPAGRPVGRAVMASTAGGALAEVVDPRHGRGCRPATRPRLVS